MDKYPDNLLERIRNLERMVEQLTASTGRPTTLASAGWILPSMGTPAAPASGVHIYGSGNNLMFMTASGVVRRVPWTGNAVVDPLPQVATPLAPGATVTADAYNRLGFDTDQVWDVLVALLVSLRSAGIIAT